MFRVSIKNIEQVETNAAQFETEQEASAWVLDNADYFPEGHTSEVVDVTQVLAAAKQKAEALKYLADTDWYIVRMAETAKPIPQLVLDKRAESRLKIV